MFNKIKNFFNRSKKAIDNKCNEIYCKAQTAVANAKAELADCPRGHSAGSHFCLCFCMRPYRTTLLMKRTIYCPL